MQIVINVDNELYEYFSKRRTMHDNGYFSHVGKLIKAFRDGTPLPKGHGRLIDADKLWDSYHNLDYDFYEAFDLADTIIKADK